MFTKAPAEPTHLEKVIDETLSKLEETDPTSDEFAKIVDQLDKLHKMLPKKEPLVKPDTLIPVIGNLAGILAILNFERANVITTKALSFVMKTRV
jgi:hypothetical protein